MSRKTGTRPGGVVAEHRLVQSLERGATHKPRCLNSTPQMEFLRSRKTWWVKK